MIPDCDGQRDGQTDRHTAESAVLYASVYVYAHCIVSYMRTRCKNSEWNYLAFSASNLAIAIFRLSVVIANTIVLMTLLFSSLWSTLPDLSLGFRRMCRS